MSAAEDKNVRDEFVIGAERKAAVVIKEMWLINVYGLLLREIRKILRVGHFLSSSCPRRWCFGFMTSNRKH